MPARNYTTLATSEVFCVTNLETKKWHRVFSPEQLAEMVEDGRINENHRVTIMNSNSGLGGDRGVEKEKSNRPILSSRTQWYYSKGE